MTRAKIDYSGEVHKNGKSILLRRVEDSGRNARYSVSCSTCSQSWDLFLTSWRASPNPQCPSCLPRVGPGERSDRSGERKPGGMSQLVERVENDANGLPMYRVSCSTPRCFVEWVTRLGQWSKTRAPMCPTCRSRRDAKEAVTA